ncbi:hypothetical protein PoB_005000900 [Plakobranchus ocellatus]|uniref:Uncharacterized protein n=1 Tax=Plakobranchus ocellatus TaxID=259542 RepID=A0AAV4BYN6_9GAST|nr:hypothetical protein PoB_005000900 [Plakobranchus ocellatus]
MENIKNAEEEEEDEEEEEERGLEGGAGGGRKVRPPPCVNHLELVGPKEIKKKTVSKTVPDSKDIDDLTFQQAQAWNRFHTRHCYASVC